MGEQITTLRRYCVTCGYMPCGCPYYEEDDKYELGYGLMMENTQEVFRSHYRMFHISDELYDSVLPVVRGLCD